MKGVSHCARRAATRNALLVWQAGSSWLHNTLRGEWVRCLTVVLKRPSCTHFYGFTTFSYIPKVVVLEAMVLVRTRHETNEKVTRDVSESCTICG